MVGENGERKCDVTVSEVTEQLLHVNFYVVVFSAIPRMSGILYSVLLFIIDVQYPG